MGTLWLAAAFDVDEARSGASMALAEEHYDGRDDNREEDWGHGA